VHNTKVGGHSGILRTFKKLRLQFYWPGMHKSVRDYIRGREICQKVKVETLSPARLLQPLPILCQVWDDITLDFIEGLPLSQGKDTIMVVVDQLSKSAHFLPLSHPFTIKTVAEKFMEGIIKLHDMPKSIVSDCDPIFISYFWQEFSRCRAPNYNLVLYIILKQKAKLKSSTAVLSNTFGVLFINCQESGVVTYHGLSISITPHFTFPHG